MKFDESCPVSSPVAPCSSLIGFHIRWDSSGNAINPWRARGKAATELDHCQMGVSYGLAAAHSRCRHSGGAQRDGRHQSEPDRRDAPRHFVSRRALRYAAARALYDIRDQVLTASRGRTNEKFLPGVRRADVPAGTEARSGGSLEDLTTDLH